MMLHKILQTLRMLMPERKTFLTSRTCFYGFKVMSIDGISPFKNADMIRKIWEMKIHDAE